MNIFELFTQDQSVSRDLYESLMLEQNAWFQYKAFLEQIKKGVIMSDQIYQNLWSDLIQARVVDVCFQDFKYQIKDLMTQLKSDTTVMQNALKVVQVLQGVQGQSRNYVKDFQDELFIHFEQENNRTSLIDIKAQFQRNIIDADVEQLVDINWSIQGQDNNTVVDEQQQIDFLLIVSIQLLQKFKVNVTETFEPFLYQLQQLYDQVICRTIDNYNLQSSTQLKEEIQRALLEIHSSIIIKNLFDCILYYPETFDLIMEFKSSIQQTQLFTEMEMSLCLNIKNRLLITGVITQSILTFYISVLKVLQIVDLHGQIFNKVTFPIKEYLLKRSDCLRCIIQLLTSENYNKMTSEKVIIPSNNNDNYSSDDECGSKYQEKDLVSILISLYGSQEAFITEYQNMLAEKILGAKDFQIEDEIKNIELMKMRFGETQMQTSNIIVKDVKESKRVDTNVHTIFKDQIRGCESLLRIDHLHPLFLSKTYWPINYEFKETFLLPSQMQEVFQEYTKKYEHLKIMRKLLWHHELGSVTLTLSFDNGDFDFRCLPIHAALLDHFDESKLNQNHMIQSDQLAKEMEMSHDDLKRRMTFWTQRGVIRGVQQGQGESSKPPSYKKQLSSNDVDSDIIFYFPAKQYQDRQEDTETHLLDELPDDILQSHQYASLPNIVQHLSTMITSIIMQTGPKTQEKISLLIRTKYQVGSTQAITENQIKEAIKVLINSGQLYQTGEIYTI